MILKLFIDYDNSNKQRQRGLHDRFYGKPFIYVTIENLIAAVKAKHPIMPAVVDWNQDDEDKLLIEQQVVFASINNLFPNSVKITPEAVLEICKLKEIEPAFYYITDSFDTPSFNLVFVLDKPITDSHEREILLGNLVKAIPQCGQINHELDDMYEHDDVRDVVICNKNSKVKLSTLRSLKTGESIESIQYELEKIELEKYNNNPIVKIIRFEVDRNDGCWEAGAEELNIAMAKKLGVAFPGDLSMLGRNINKLVPRLIEIDKIGHRTENKGNNGGRKHIFKKLL